MPRVARGQPLSLEHVAKMASATSALDFDPLSVRVGHAFHRPGALLVERGPTAVGVELVVGPVERRAALPARIRSGSEEPVILPGERHLGALVEDHAGFGAREGPALDLLGFGHAPIHEVTHYKLDPDRSSVRLPGPRVGADGTPALGGHGSFPKRPYIEIDSSIYVSGEIVPARLVGLYALRCMERDGAVHGYSLSERIAERTGGVWRPGPGAIYPALQRLTDRGLARSRLVGRRRVYTITPKGRESLARLRAQTAGWTSRAPDLSALWADVAGVDDVATFLLMRLRRALDAIDATLASAPPRGTAVRRCARSGPMCSPSSRPASPSSADARLVP